MYYMLESDRLRVEIADPEEVHNLATRFDATGYITEVTLDGAVRFCGSEPGNLGVPSSGGRGLCSEYRFDCIQETKAGDYFPKFGVGLLRRDEGEDHFNHFKKYVCRPFDYTLEKHTGDMVSFRTSPKECLGYAAETIRTISVKENVLTMEISLINVGERDIVLKEYCHNFLSLDGMAVTGAYRLSLPQVHNLDAIINRKQISREFFMTEKGCVRAKGYKPHPAIFDYQAEDIDSVIPFCWELRHEENNVSVKGTEYFVPCEGCVWVADHLFCPEINIGISVAPNASYSWKREWKWERK